MTITRILVPTDFSEPAREATDQALVFAKAFGASIDLLHVIQDPIVYIPALGGYTPLPRDMENFSDTALAAWIDSDVSGGISIRRHWVHGHPVGKILKFAEQHNSDMIVMGTHGRGMLGHMLGHMLMGSVAERVVRQAKCPVLTVHPARAFDEGVELATSAAEA